MPCRPKGFACGVVDITSVTEGGITANQLYLGIVKKLRASFGLSVLPRQWWREQGDISPVQKLGDFIQEVLLPSVPTPMVVFIDEIDSILRIPLRMTFLPCCDRSTASGPTTLNTNASPLPCWG
jgi:hypothetical protein